MTIEWVLCSASPEDLVQICIPGLDSLDIEDNYEPVPVQEIKQVLKQQKRKAQRKLRKRKRRRRRSRQQQQRSHFAKQYKMN